jgi:hypothetical protein
MPTWAEYLGLVQPSGGAFGTATPQEAGNVLTPGEVLTAAGAGPSWLDRARAQAASDVTAYQQGGVPGLMEQTASPMGLAGGFGGVIKGVGGPIRAYHGSPYDFERFDLSKVGTGEGAQAYGHGLYFAENPAVAGSYKNVLGGREFQIGDKKLYTSTGGATTTENQTRGETIAADALDDAFNAQSVEPAQFASNRLRYQKRLYPEEGRHIDEALNLIGDWQQSGSSQKLQGRMYEVNINAAPEQFLNWDRPISEQSPQVRETYNRMTGYPDPELSKVRVRETDALMQQLAEQRDPVTNQMLNEPQWFKYARDRDRAWAEWNAAQSGQKAYEALGSASAMRSSPIWQGIAPNINRRAAASELLQREGIPGISYLDQLSRGGGQGTSNYVVFNPDIIDIIRKYGLAGAVTPAGVLMGAGQQPQQQ